MTNDMVSRQFAENCAREVIAWKVGEKASDDRRRFHWLAQTMAQYIQQGTPDQQAAPWLPIDDGAKRGVHWIADKSDEYIGYWNGEQWRMIGGQRPFYEPIEYKPLAPNGWLRNVRAKAKEPT